MKHVTINDFVKLSDDEAFQFSVDNNDAYNMQLVLRAHGYIHTLEYAQDTIDLAKAVIKHAESSKVFD